MAYLAFHDADGIAVGSFADRPRPVAAPVADGLTALEWSVVTIARTDSLSSLRRPGLLTRLVRVMLQSRKTMLADPRLEALRRIAVLTWRHGYTIASDEVRAFLAAGFTPGQYETMANAIGAARAKARAARRG